MALNGVVVVSQKEQVCSLGVVLYSVLLLDKQVAGVARSVFQQLGLVGKLCPFWKQRDIASVTHALVTL